jgi:hypothetical protein
VSKVLHEGVIYRYIILTVPAMFHADLLPKGGVGERVDAMRVQCLDAFLGEVRGKTSGGTP